MCIYSYGAFLWIKIVVNEISFCVNVYVFISIVLFYCSKRLKMGFLFSVNAYAFIPMVVFYC